MSEQVKLTQSQILVAEALQARIQAIAPQIASQPEFDVNALHNQAINVAAALSAGVENDSLYTTLTDVVVHIVAHSVSQAAVSQSLSEQLEQMRESLTTSEGAQETIKDPQIDTAVTSTDSE